MLIFGVNAFKFLRINCLVEYISIHHGPCLLRIDYMHGFFHACGLPNVCGTIDGSYIPLSQNPNKWATIVPTIIIIVDEKL
jgi:hypothetical protein